jgi:hypothetical protein
VVLKRKQLQVKYGVNTECKETAVKYYENVPIIVTATNLVTTVLFLLYDQSIFRRNV